MPSPMVSSQPRDWNQVSHSAVDSLPLKSMGKSKNTGVGSLPLSNPGIKLEPPALLVDSLPAELQESPIYTYMKWSEVKPLSRVWLFATQWIIACQALPSIWDFPGKNSGVGCHFLLQRIFPIQGLNPGLPHCRQTLYHLSYIYILVYKF